VCHALACGGTIDEPLRQSANAFEQSWLGEYASISQLLLAFEADTHVPCNPSAATPPVHIKLFKKAVHELQTGECAYVWGRRTRGGKAGEDQSGDISACGMWEAHRLLQQATSPVT
jgi:hypothetical protein